MQRLAAATLAAKAKLAVTPEQLDYLEARYRLIAVELARLRPERLVELVGQVRVESDHVVSRCPPPGWPRPLDIPVQQDARPDLHLRSEARLTRSRRAVRLAQLDALGEERTDRAMVRLIARGLRWWGLN